MGARAKAWCTLIHAEVSLSIENKHTHSIDVEPPPPPLRVSVAFGPVGKCLDRGSSAFSQWPERVLARDKFMGCRRRGS